MTAGQYKYSPLAQSVERRTVNPCVVGSSPTGGAKEKRHACACRFFLISVGLESRLLATVRWTVATGVAFPQKSESILAHHFPK